MPAAPTVTDLMRTLADPTRLAIYQRIIAERETTVGALTVHAGVSQPAVSQHVKVLADAHLIDGRREGRKMFYRADPRGLKPLGEWIRFYERFWEESFDRLDTYLKAVKAKEQRGEQRSTT
jgi:DNA-binding transcriptional ArsR family regulator